MEVVICYCLKCKSEIGRFRNAWNGIGNTYFSPIYNLVSGAGLETTGDIYEAANGSSIQNSLLRDVVCAKCRVVLGLRCDSAPDNHILKQNQLILRLKETTIISEGSGKVADLSVLKVIPLKDDKNTNSSTFPQTPSTIPSIRPSVSHSSFRNHKFSGVYGDFSEQHNSKRLQEIAQPKQHDFETEINSLTIGVEKFRGWAEETILSQQKDIDRLSGTMLRIERDMQTLKSYMQELNNKFASDYHSKNQCKEVAEVRNEIKRVNVRLDQKEEVPEWNKAASLLARNMKTIAGDVKKLSSQAEKISGFKKTLEDLASRLEYLEIQDQSIDYEKIPSLNRDISSETLSLKRNHDLVERNAWDRRKTDDQARMKFKKQRSDEIRQKEDLKSNSQKQNLDIVDLVSPEPDLLNVDKKDKINLEQDNLPAFKRGISHQTPQVLIRASNNAVNLLLQESKKSPEFPPRAGSITDPKSHLLLKNDVIEEDKKRRKSNSIIQDSSKRLYPILSDNIERKTDNLELNHYAKLVGRHLRARKSKALKD
ncbi:hypothetical protein EV44_g2998 [Erysiphe necator]|uniref:Uncharacterized protein n=1 Tax=Uncinula necator TaxID=52586 RepID=A0A0B1PBB9_UNCNE|nr:hypothetical protein EV44_g2998 [Erysiphe necator]